MGSRWTVQDVNQLARLIAIVAMGQATAAAHIIQNLMPAAPAFTADELINEAVIRLTVGGKKNDVRFGYPKAQRDGFLFEVISWVATRQLAGPMSYLLDPHTSATSQGLDGLMLELASDGKSIARTTIFEDKCTENPRALFLAQVMPSFLDRHGRKRSVELVAAGSLLLKLSGMNDLESSQASQRILEKKIRRYRASFAVTPQADSTQERQSLFKGYEALDELSADQRVGACLVAGDKFREWFEELAKLSILYLKSLKAPAVV